MLKNLSEIEKGPKFLKYFSNKKITKSAFSEGEKREIKLSYLDKAYDSLTKVVFETDSKVIKKYGVKSSKHDG
ncbi:MAG: hypothetical protein ACYSR0_09710 [Planctomycetota bacterium]|jgi:hypothetical protein